MANFKKGDIVLVINLRKLPEFGVIRRIPETPRGWYDVIATSFGGKIAPSRVRPVSEAENFTLKDFRKGDLVDFQNHGKTFGFYWRHGEILERLPSDKFFYRIKSDEYVVEQTVHQDHIRHAANPQTD